MRIAAAARRILAPLLLVVPAVAVGSTAGQSVMPAWLAGTEWMLVDPVVASDPAEVVASRPVDPVASDPADGVASATADAIASNTANASASNSIDRVRPTIAFAEPGRVAGSGGCNRFGASARFDGESVRIEQLIATRRACSPRSMAIERDYLAAVANLMRLEMNGDALLLHSKHGAQPMRFSRVHR